MIHSQTMRWKSWYSFTDIVISKDENTLFPSSNHGYFINFSSLSLSLHIYIYTKLCHMLNFFGPKTLMGFEIIY